MPSYEEIEDLWADRLEKAERTYKEALTDLHATIEEFRSRDLPQPESALTLRLAIELEKEAVAEYVRVLRIFTDLVVRKKIPPEEY